MKLNESTVISIVYLYTFYHVMASLRFLNRTQNVICKHLILLIKQKGASYDNLVDSSKSAKKKSRTYQNKNKLLSNGRSEVTLVANWVSVSTRTSPNRNHIHKKIWKIIMLT